MVLITAFRNNTWIEWAFYCSTVMRKLGVESTVIVKNNEIQSIFKEKKEKQFIELVKQIPGIEVLDIESFDYDSDLFFYIEIFHNSILCKGKQ